MTQDGPIEGEVTEQVIRGVIERVTFRNPDNGYSVLQVSIPGQSGVLTVVGTAPSAATGTQVVARGLYTHHQKFGKQFAAISITEMEPSEPEDIARYLGSGVIKGIGEKTAERLVNLYGAETLNIIYSDPERLAKVPGIGKRKAKLISESFAQQNETRETFRFLIEHKISNNLSHRIIKTYGSKTIELIKKDPYRLARDISGVGFITADSIAMSIGIRPESPERIRAGMIYALEKASDDGHCFLPKEVLAERSRVLLELPDSVDMEPELLVTLREGLVVEYEGKLYLPHLIRAEEFVAEFVAGRLTPRAEAMVPESEVRAALATASGKLGVTFSYEQEQTVFDATRHRLLVITGGPGCGKTTIIKALSLLFKDANKRLLMAAPTGRAAQRMAQVCEMPASTIHRLLKYDPIKRRFLFGPNEPLIADVVIVDEASMIDVQLAMHLFSAIPREATVILVGDRDQLPSVGPGRVFGDIVGVPEVRTISLSRLFRRSGESSINTIAHMINAGQLPDIPTPDGITKADAYFIPKSEAEEAAVMVEKLVSDQIPKKFGLSPSEITVLTPTNRGPLGTIALNKRIQERVNPSGSRDIEQELTVGETILRLGDRVCQTVNNYNLGDTGVFNGDAGTIYEVNRKEHLVTVEMWDGRLVKYAASDLYQLSLAYAISVHRSQGSEIPCVIFALHDSHYTLLERQLIYTGVTRAKKLLIVVGSKRALSLACKRQTANKRCTFLKERIKIATDGKIGAQLRLA